MPPIVLDHGTIRQNDIDNGRPVCETGVAPIRPAGFVIIRPSLATA